MIFIRIKCRDVIFSFDLVLPVTYSSEFKNLYYFFFIFFFNLYDYFIFFWRQQANIFYLKFYIGNEIKQRIKKVSSNFYIREIFGVYKKK